MGPRSDSGQAAVEHLALVAVVATLVVIGALALDGRAIAAATVAQIGRGLCLVEGHDCVVVHPPCSLSSRRSGNDLNVDVAVVRLGGGSSSIVERRSDGKVYVTVADHLDAGGSGGFGGRLELGDRIALGGEARAAVLASLGHGATYAVADERQAAAPIRLLHRPKVDPNFFTPAVRAYWRRVEAVLPRIPAPVTRYVDASATGSAFLGPLTATLGAGVREDLATGARTVYLKGSVSLDGGVDGNAASGAGNGQLAIRFDRHGRPLDLMVLGTGELRVSRDLPVLLSPVAGHLSAGPGRSWKVEAHLDLTQPGRADAVRAELQHPAALVRRILAEGSVQVSSYAGVSGRVALGVHLAAGAGFGGEIAHTTQGMRLVAALEHTPQGFWVPRFDCMAAV